LADDSVVDGFDSVAAGLASPDFDSDFDSGFDSDAAAASLVGTSSDEELPDDFEA